MLTYSEAQSLMESARTPANGKPLQNNTRLYERGEGFAVQLHATDVVTVLPNGRYRLDTGGWYTVTTRDRINSYAPVYRTLSTYRGEWSLRCRPKDDDPEPDYPHRTIPRPYTASDPGPEPVKDSNGCQVGFKHTIGRMENKHVMDSEVRPSDRPGFYGDELEKIDNAPTRARSVLEWIKAVEPSYTFWVVRRYECERILYCEETNSWQRPDAPPGWKAEQCPHCKAFAALHRDWSLRMNGKAWGANAGRGYDTYCDMLERYGSMEAWREAYKLDGREVRAGQKLWNEWDRRNRIPFANGVIVDSEGYPLRKEQERIKKAERAAERAERRRQREHEARERRHRELERFKQRMKERRIDRSFAYAAHEAAAKLAAVRIPTNELESDDDDG